MAEKTKLEIIDMVQNCIGRELNDEAKNSKITLYESGVDSIELVNILVVIETNANISLDSLLGMLEVITIDVLLQETITEMDRSIKRVGEIKDVYTKETAVHMVGYVPYPI